MGLTHTEKILIDIGVTATQAHSEIEKLGRRLDGTWENINKLNKIYEKGQRKSNQMIAKANKEFNKLVAVQKKIKAGFLSTLFAGNAIKNFFSSLTRPALEVVGVFDLWSTMLQITFLPIALSVLEDIMLPLFEVMTNLPEGIQTAIGAFALMGTAFGDILLFAATFKYVFGTDLLATIATFVGKLGGIKSILSTLGIVLVTFTLAKDAYDAIKKDRPLDVLVDIMTAASIYTFGLMSVPGGVALALWLTWKFVIPEEAKTAFQNWLLDIGEYWDKFIQVVIKGLNLLGARIEVPPTTKKHYKY